MSNPDGALASIDAALDDYLPLDEPDPTPTFPMVTIATDVSAFVDGMRRAAESALAGFGKAFGPFLSATQSAMHRSVYSSDRRHARRCPTCNPAGFPKPLAINGHEYNRRRRRRNRR